MRNGLCWDVGPSDDTILWQGGPYTAFPRQAGAEGSGYVVCRTFDSGDILHGTLLHALDVLTGAESWSVELPVDFPATDCRVQLIGINGGRIHATRATNVYGSYLYALSAEDASIVWRSAELVEIGGSEGIVFAPDGDLIAGNYNSIRRINAADGTIEWQGVRQSP